MEFHFDFNVTGLTEQQVESLMDHIIHFVESFDGQVGGGFVPVTENETEVGNGQENAQ